jgi:CheY-like chemotaxis protein
MRVLRFSGGLGLGLAISRSLAEAHGGTLVAKSDGRDFGATFSLTMQTTVPSERSSRDAGQDGQTQRRIGLRILLVDDHQDTCAALEKLLVHRGHLVATAHSMRSAIEAAGANRFDLLISDIALSDGSGIDLMMQLHRICGIPGIAISGFGMRGDIERSLQAGFVEHLVKPVKLEKLEAAINRITKGGVAG